MCLSGDPEDTNKPREKSHLLIWFACFQLMNKVKNQSALAADSTQTDSARDKRMKEAKHALRKPHLAPALLHHGNSRPADIIDLISSFSQNTRQR